jgi:hypothetical protein
VVELQIRCTGAGLDIRVWINRFKGLGEAAQAVNVGDQDIVQSSIIQLVKNLQPELSTLFLLDPQAHHFFATNGADAQRPIDRPPSLTRQGSTRRPFLDLGQQLVSHPATQAIRQAALETLTVSKFAISNKV